MSVTVDCGEGRHDLCAGAGRRARLIRQKAKNARARVAWDWHEDRDFTCRCRCHRGEARP